MRISTAFLLTSFLGLLATALPAQHGSRGLSDDARQELRELIRTEVRAVVRAEIRNALKDAHRAQPIVAQVHGGKAAHRDVGVEIHRAHGGGVTGARRALLELEGAHKVHLRHVEKTQKSGSKTGNKNGRVGAWLRAGEGEGADQVLFLRREGNKGKNVRRARLLRVHKDEEDDDDEDDDHAKAFKVRVGGVLRAIPKGDNHDRRVRRVRAFFSRIEDSNQDSEECCAGATNCCAAELPPCCAGSAKANEESNHPHVIKVRRLNI